MQGFDNKFKDFPDYILGLLMRYGNKEELKLLIIIIVTI